MDHWRNLHAVLVRPYVGFSRETPRLHLPTAFGRLGEHSCILRWCCTVSGLTTRMTDSEQGWCRDERPARAIAHQLFLVPAVVPCRDGKKRMDGNLPGIVLQCGMVYERFLAT